MAQLGRVIGYNVSEKDIAHVTRVAKADRSNPRPRAIVVQFTSPRIRDGYLAATVKFNKANPKDKLNTSHVGIGGETRPIYVTEHLSPANKSLHAAARARAKEIATHTYGCGTAKFLCERTITLTTNSSEIRTV